MTTPVDFSTQAHKSRNEMMANQSALANLQPPTLVNILRECEIGNPQQFIDLCDRMLSIDPHIRSVYETRTAFLAGAQWQLQPGFSGDPLRDQYAAAAAEFIEAQMNRISDFSQLVTQINDAIGKGFSCHEKQWVYDGHAFVYKSIDWVNQRRFVFRGDWEIRLSDQGDVNNYNGVPLAEGKWIVHIPKGIAGYAALTGCFRPVSWCFLFKRQAIAYWVAMAEKLGSPQVVGKYPEGASAAVISKLLDGVQKMVSDSATVIPASGAIEILSAGLQNGGAHQNLHDGMNREISKAILGTVDAVEAQAVGSYAAVAVRKGATIDARKIKDERSFAHTWERDYIEPLLRANKHLWHGVVPPTPKFRFQLDIEGTDMASIPSTLIGEGIVTPNEIRAAAGLEPINDDPMADRVIRIASGGAPSAFPFTGSPEAKLSNSRKMPTRAKVSSATSSHSQSKIVQLLTRRSARRQS